MLSKIPKTLKVGLVKKLSNSDSEYVRYSNEGKRLFLINPIPKKEASNSKTKSVFYYQGQRYRKCFL